MFGFLFKRKKSIDNREKDCRGNGYGKNHSNNDDSSSSSSSPSSSSIKKSSSVCQSLLSTQSQSVNVSMDNDLSNNTKMYHTLDNQQMMSSLSKSENDNNLICERNVISDSELSLNSNYFSLTDLNKGIEFIDESDTDKDNEDKFSKFESDMKNVNKTDEYVDTFKRDLSEAERNAMVELDEIRSKILTKDTEISLLHADVKMLSADRDNKIVEIEDLTCQLRRIQEENETSLATVQSIEMELGALRDKNIQLMSDLLKKTEQLTHLEENSFADEKTVKDFESRIKCLEKKIENLENEKERLTEEYEAVESEREEELRAIQNALDDALEEKIKLQNKFDSDFETLRTLCSSQEQQLMDDFEWKLRQIESTCKKKTQDKDKQCEEKLKDIKNDVFKELDEEKEKIKQEKVEVDEQMRQVSHFKAYEVELIQLRGLTHEQQKCMRSASRQIEHLKFNEKLVRDELQIMKGLLDKEKLNLQAVQASHQGHLETYEDNLHVQIGKQRNELNSKFEERMRAECSRLKQELNKHHADEKHLAVESMKLHKDQELSSIRQDWEKQKQDLIQEITILKDNIIEKESWCNQELENLKIEADKKNWELHKKMEKENILHDELITKLNENHKDELDSLKKQYDIVVERLKEVEKKLIEAEQKHNKLANYEVLNGKLSPIPQTNPVNKSDSGCGDDDGSEEYEDDEDADEEDDESEDESDEKIVVENKKSSSLIKNDDNTSNTTSCSSSGRIEETVVHNLREEVATLQGSIEKLTSTLTKEVVEIDDVDTSHTSTLDTSEKTSSSEEENTSTSESDDDE